MQGGFSFCGAEITDFGLEYVPQNNETWVYGHSNYQTNEQSYEGHHGGYYYGTTIQPKEFHLRCLYEESEIIAGILSRVESFFYPGRTGKLIFNNRNWLYYIATVVNIDTTNIVNKQNGFITIHLKAYYPFGRCDKDYLTYDGLYDDYLAGNSGLLEEEYTPTKEYTLNQAGEYTKNILLYNGGSSAAHVAVAIAGKAGYGVTIKNNTNNTEMKLVVFDTTTEDMKDKYVMCDSINFKTVLTDGTTSKLAFTYHDHGFIKLEPSFPIHRDVYVDTRAGSDEIYSFHLFSDFMLGHYAYIEDKWVKIVEIIDDNRARLETPCTYTNYALTNIVKMNEVSIITTPDSDIKWVKFIYKPTFM